MGKTRKGFLWLLLAGIFLLLADFGQRWIYLNALPEIPELTQRGDGADVTRSILVAGAGLDELELATGLRDLVTAKNSLLNSIDGSHHMRLLHPGQNDYAPATFLDFIADSDDCKQLVVYLTGHGGGFNFGATSEFNLKASDILKALSEVECSQILVVIDCCWSGRFQVEAEAFEFASPVTIVTSTDAEHPSPFPVSFLSPRSFGAMFFDHLDLGVERAFDKTNNTRSRLEFLFSEEMGLTGTFSRIGLKESTE